MSLKKKITVKNILWYFFFGIGYLILITDYFTPQEWGKKRNVSTTGRRYNKKHLWGPIYAIFIYFLIGIFLFV